MVHGSLFRFGKCVGELAKKRECVVSHAAVSFEDDRCDVVWCVFAFLVVLRSLA